MSFASIEIAMLNHFQAVAAANSLPFDYGNGCQTTGNWARVTIKHNPSTPGDIQSGRFKYLGIVFIQLFTPLGLQVTEKRALVSAIVSHFRTASLPDIWCRSIAANGIGVDGAHYQTNIEIQFEADQAD